MEKFVPYEKMSKRRQKEIDKIKRNTWGALKPVTRKVKNAKAYKSEKFRFNGHEDQWSGTFYFCFV